MMRFRFLPPDPALPDAFAGKGEIALTVNALYRDGAILPSGPVTSDYVDRDNGGCRLLCTHRTPNALNRIFAAEGEGETLLTYRPSDPHASPDSSSAPVEIGRTDTVVDATPTGNIVALVTASGLRYLVWNGDAYTLLANHPPEIPLRFGMLKVGQLSDMTTIEVDRSCVPVFNTSSGESSDSSVTGGGWSTDSTRNPPTPAALSELAVLLYGHLDRAIDRIVYPNGYFWQPFLIRYAYRLFDGSHIFHSQPILMTPVSTVPQITLSRVTDGADEDHRRVVTALRVPYFKLTAHILPDNSLDELTKWRDLIAGIDIFVSDPLPTYSPTLPPSGVPYCGERQFYASSVPGTGARDTSAHTLPDRVFVGRYSESSNENYRDHYVDLSGLTDNNVFWAVPVNPDFDRMVVDAHLFNLIAHIPTERFLNLRQPAEIPVLSPHSSNGVSRIGDPDPASLADDWKSRWEIVPSCSCRLNGRLILGGISMKLPRPLPLPDFDGVSGDNGGDGKYSRDTLIIVSSRVNGMTSKQSCLSPSPSSGLSESFPRYLYYPDRSASQLTIRRMGEGTYVLPLTPHPRLNGAYFYAGLLPADLLAEEYKVDYKEEYEEEESTETSTTACSSFVCPPLLPYDSLIMVSDEDNPLHFPLNSSVNIVDGPVVSFCPMTGPNYQSRTVPHQFYAISDSGIWTIGLSAGGLPSLSSRIALPFTGGDTIKSVPVPSGAILSCDGRLWRLVDKDIKPIQSPPWSLLKELGLVDPETEEKVGLMSYDSANQQVVFSIPATADRLAFSLSSSLWGLFLAAHAADTPWTNKAGIITRPLRLDSDGLRGRMKDIRVEGCIPDPRSLTLALFGSDNLAHWRLTASGPSPLSSLLGSPSRFYRLVLTFPLNPALSVHGLTILSKVCRTSKN